MSAGRSQASDLAREREGLRKLAMRLTRDRGAADDLVQDALTVAWQGRTAGREPAVLGPWLRGVLRMLHRNRTRAEALRVARECDSAARDDAPATPEGAIAAHELAAIVAREVDALREPLRAAVQLMYFHGMRAVDAAAVLGVPASTVRKRNQLALAHLRRRLDERFGGRRDDWRRALVVAFASRSSGGRGTASSWALAVAAAGLCVAASLHGGAKPIGPATGAPALARAVAAPAFLTTDRASGPSAAPEASSGACPPLRAQIAAAAPGAIVRVPACVYREFVIVDRPVELVAEPGAELRGSDLVEGFERVGDQAAWRSRALAFLPPRSLRSVYRDGVPLAPVDAAPGPGEYAFDAEDRLVIGAPPGPSSIEIAARALWIKVMANDVTIEGFRMRHLANLDRDGGIDVDTPWRGLVVRRNDLADASGAAIAIGGDDHVIEDNRISGADVAIRLVPPTDRAMVRGNVLVGNGRPRSSRDSIWRAAGVFAAQAHAARILDNEVTDNAGSGFVCFACRGVVLADNLVTANTGADVLFDARSR